MCGAKRFSSAGRNSLQWAFSLSVPQELYQSKSEQGFANRWSLPWCWTGVSHLDAGQVYLTLMLDRCSYLDAGQVYLTLMLDRCILPWCWIGVLTLMLDRCLTLMLDRCSGAVMTFPLRSSWFMRRKAMMLILVTSSAVTYENTQIH